VERILLQRVYGTHDLVFVSGARSSDDILRGEETELMGILEEPSLRKFQGSSTAILPGTHSKVIQIQNGAIVDFRTYLTGELFEVLRQHSILKHSVDPEPNSDEGALEFFDLGVKRAADIGLLESLFSVRTNVVLKGIPRDFNTLYLSGLLIGTEVRSILTHSNRDSHIVLGGKPSLQMFYGRAFQVLGESGRLFAVPEEITSIAAALGHWVLRPIIEENRIGKENSSRVSEK
jgi:2-dehydro-3-deoxygalactonokinase